MEQKQKFKTLLLDKLLKLNKNIMPVAKKQVVKASKTSSKSQNAPVVDSLEPKVEMYEGQEVVSKVTKIINGIEYIETEVVGGIKYTDRK